MSGEQVTIQSSDIEVSVLACLANAATNKRPDVIKKCAATVKRSEVFAQKEHGFIYDAIVSLAERMDIFDLTLLTEELKRQGNYNSVDKEKLSGLFSGDVNLANTEEYAHLVVEEYIRRCGIIWSRALAEGLSERRYEPAELLNQAKNYLEKLIEECATEEAVHVGELVDDVIGQIESPHRSLVPTGFEKLDELVGGVMPGEFIVVAARPSMGKTSLALCMARNLARRGVRVAFVSLEMMKHQLTTNLLIIDSGVKSHIVRKLNSPDICDADWEKLKESRVRIKSYHIRIADQIGKTSDIYANLSSLIAKHNIKVVFVDYLQLVTPPKGNSLYEQVTEISRDFKKMAKDLDIPLVVLAQLNRAPEHRDNKRPVMADLRDSGAIEQDADQIWLLHRPHYYDKHADETKAELSVAKNRTGPTGKVDMVWHKQIMRFEDCRERTGQV